MNLVNKHYTRNADQVLDNLSEAEVPKRIFQSRPNLVLNIGNEYLTTELMTQMKEFYGNTALPMPKRHFLTRFGRDFKERHREAIDFCHFTVPLYTANANGYKFPSEYIGQYGIYEAIKHVY